MFKNGESKSSGYSGVPTGPSTNRQGPIQTKCTNKVSPPTAPGAGDVMPRTAATGRVNPPSGPRGR